MFERRWWPRWLVVGFGTQQATSQTFSADELSRRTIERRAVEAVIWGMPAVNYDLMRQAAIHEAKGAENWNQIAYWSQLLRVGRTRRSPPTTLTPST